MKNSHLFNKSIFALIFYISAIFSPPIHGLVCPEKVSSSSMNVVYIKYQISDQAQILINQRAGYSNVVGDEFRELYMNKNFRKERLYGRLVADDMKHFNKQMAIAIEKGNNIEKRQNRGEDVPLEEIDKVTQVFTDNAYKLKVKEYDRINITTPEYDGKFNESSKKGYGIYRQVRGQSQQVLSESIRENNTWLLSQAGLLNQKFGFLNTKASTSKILNYVCKHTIIDVSNKGWNRELGQMEVCTSKINGLDIVLSAAMGESGKRYSMKAIKILPDLKVSKNEFCLPDYVKMK